MRIVLDFAKQMKSGNCENGTLHADLFNDITLLESQLSRLTTVIAYVQKQTVTDKLSVLE